MSKFKNLWHNIWFNFHLNRYCLYSNYKSNKHEQFKLYHQNKMNYHFKHITKLLQKLIKAKGEQE